MRKLIITAACIATALISIGCAKQQKIGANDADKRYFEAWLKVNNINVEPSGRGIYVLEDTPGKGREVIANGFAFLEFVTTDLNGNVTSYTNADMAKKLGEFSPSTYYGPEFISTYDGNIYAGVFDMLKDMKVGGTRKAIVPSWLISYKNYDSESQYLETATNQNSAIYEVKVKDFTTDINRWERDTVCRFFANKNVMVAGKPANEVFTNDKGWTMSEEDTLKTGFWYKQLKAPVDTTSFPSDTTLYINYTGMTLDGRVFDTTIEDIAKDHNIYVAGKTYEPVSINWPSEGEEFTSVTMGTSESTLINGFSYTIWQMRAMEEGVGIFTSSHGYGNTGSGESIPGYAPLIFHIQIVEQPKE